VTSLLGIYRPRNTPMHLAPAWFKALLLLAVAIVAVLLTDPVNSALVMGACVMLLISTGPPLKPTVMVALALAVTSSTRMEEMLNLISRGLRPLRRIVPPETIGLMFALMLRVIPEVVRILSESRDAARARGMDRSPRAILVPTATRTVGFALQLGQALHARGIAEEGDAPAKYRRARRSR